MTAPFYFITRRLRPGLVWRHGELPMRRRCDECRRKVACSIQEFDRALANPTRCGRRVHTVCLHCAATKDDVPPYIKTIALSELEKHP